MAQLTGLVSESALPRLAGSSPGLGQCLLPSQERPGEASTKVGGRGAPCWAPRNHMVLCSLPESPSPSPEWITPLESTGALLFSGWKQKCPCFLSRPIQEKLEPCLLLPRLIWELKSELIQPVLVSVSTQTNLPPTFRIRSLVLCPQGPWRCLLPVADQLTTPEA